MELFNRTDIDTTYVTLVEMRSFVAERLKALLGLERDLAFTIELSITQNWVNFNMDLDQLDDTEYQNYCGLFGEDVVGDSILDRVLELTYGDENSFHYLVEDMKGFYIIKEGTENKTYKNKDKYVLSFNEEQFFLDFYTSDSLEELKESMKGKTILEIYNEFLDFICSDSIAEDIEEAKGCCVIGVYKELEVDNETSQLAPKVEKIIKYDSDVFNYK